MIWIRNIRLRPGNREHGFAMIMVIAIGAVLMILATVASTYAISGLTKANHDQDYSGALAAAYAGIEEYQSRLANDTTYAQYGNTAANFSSGSTLTLPSGSQANNAFGVGPSAQWATVAGSGGLAQYRYEVNNSAYSSTGIIKIRSTGLVGNLTRSIVANLKQQGFIDFLYFTDYEIQDPIISSDPSSCAMYAWAGRDSSCQTIKFGVNDVIKGPVHSNDTLQICGSTFNNGVVSTSNNTPDGAGNLYRIPSSSCGTANFGPGNIYKPVYGPVVGMPSTNSQLVKETRSDLLALGVPNPGCLYTGPTSITYNLSGTMTVRSPWTIFTNTAGSPASSGTISSRCGTPGAGTNTLGSSTGQTLAVPTQAVIFVQTVPLVSSDPNYWGPRIPPGYSCTGAAGGRTIGNGLGFPTTNEVAPSGTSTPYGCQNGDVFVKGTLSGNTAAGSQETVAADNYIYITGDLRYNDPSADLLGLVGNNAVWVWNPLTSRNANILTDTNREVDAAVLSLNHTFQVQNYAGGSVRGTLSVDGAIAQRFRGPVGSGTSSGIVSGYAKNYLYDARLKYTAPPKFLSPVTTTYGVTTWIDVAPAFAADGSKNAGT